MRERITKEQILSLDSDQLGKLKQMWHPSRHDVILLKSIGKDDYLESSIYDKSLDDNILWLVDIDYAYETNIEVEKEYCLPLLSIGQMIEILEYENEFQIRKWQDWMVYTNKTGEIENLSLVDALWIAIKEIL